MEHIYAEKVFEAVLDEAYGKLDERCRENCPLLKELYLRLGSMKAVNNERVLEEMERLKDLHCGRCDRR